MPDAYVYQAALWCRDCADALRARLAWAPGSDDYPQGPYAGGGGEADAPQHCDGCGAFLENPLTPDGDAYARGAAEEYETRPGMSWEEIARAAEADGKAVLAGWVRFYFAWGQ